MESDPLHEDILRSLYNDFYMSIYKKWDNFINKHKNDLGIRCICVRYENGIAYKYDIVNDKKWMIAKIKYGI